jgi:hypothetical protein
MEYFHDLVFLAYCWPSGAFGSGNALEGPTWTCPFAELGMNQVRKQQDAFYHTWLWARKVGVSGAGGDILLFTMMSRLYKRSVSLRKVRLKSAS